MDNYFILFQFSFFDIEGGLNPKTPPMCHVRHYSLKGYSPPQVSLIFILSYVYIRLSIGNSVYANAMIFFRFPYHVPYSLSLAGFAFVSLQLSVFCHILKYKVYKHKFRNSAKESLVIWEYNFNFSSLI